MKSMKKLVLVGLVLLASVMVLVGCDTNAGDGSGKSEIPKCTVKFSKGSNTDDVSDLPAELRVESGTVLTVEQLKSLDDTVNCCFTGWYDGETQAKGGEYTVTKDVTLVASWRNRDTNAGGSAEIINSEIGQVLTFSAESEQTLTVRVFGNYTLPDSLEYSVGGGEWKKLQADAAISFGGTAGDLRMRGKSLEGMAKGSAIYAYIVFGYDDVKVSCSGDIRTLVDYESPTTVDTSEARFSYLFKNCSVLTKAPALPAENLADYCYESMFYGCTSLTSAPALPAEKLADYCYYGMFEGCTSLTRAPELAAETLAEGCYCGMFYGCTSLDSAPALDATTLVPFCYAHMFYGCTSLTSAPALDATTLVRLCYYYMFYGCTNLTSAPALPAETLAEDCYYAMFSGCTKLNSVTMLATDISADSCLDGWLENVSKTGTFTMAAEMDESKFSRGTNGIPTGWTVKKYDSQQ